MSDKPNKNDETQKADAADSNNEPDAVGYGKPPTSGRFQKGKSGNPRGRPKKKAAPKRYKFQDGTFDHFLEEEVFRSVRAIENGKPIDMPVQQALQRRYLNLALGGNRVALQNLLELVQEKERMHYEKKLLRYDAFEKIKLQGEATLAECRRKGIPPPELIPHPDDIELVALTGEVVFHGPLTVEDARKWEYWARLRDYLFCNAVRACKGINFFKEEDGKRYMHVGYYKSYYIDTQVLPRRYRNKGESSQITLASSCIGPKREWAKRMAQEKAWLEANHHMHPTETITSQEYVDALRNYCHSGLANSWFSFEMPGDLPEFRKATLTNTFKELAAFWGNSGLNTQPIAQ